MNKDSPLQSQARAQFARLAKDWQNTPFAHRMMKKSVGADCVGLVYGAFYEQFGRCPWQWPKYACANDYAPHQSVPIAEILQKFQTDKPPSAGHVAFFQMPKKNHFHLGIYDGSGGLIHAHSRFGVRVEAFSSHWQNALMAWLDFHNFDENP